MAEITNMAHIGVTGLLIILIGMIKIPPLQINLWGWLGRIIGKLINGEVLEKVDQINDDLKDFRSQQDVVNIRQARQRILRFCDEILFKKRHSKEHFDEILEDIDLYETYCREHTDYKNNKAELAIATIREVYTQCLKTHDFLAYTKKEEEKS